MLGQRVNNFEIVRLLGQGGMGSVYEATHLLIKRKVAVKVLKPELAKDSELLQRFFNEARATSAIRHPNIVEVVDLGFLPDGTPYLVMELLEGESLLTRLERVGRMGHEAAVEIAKQTASALEAAHQNGIIHRDLKPDNLFLVRDQRFADREQVKVLDFGIAKLRGDPSANAIDTEAGTIWGTPPYMSPEQCRGLPSQIDHRTDIYALGVILYEALTGEPPFLSEGIGDVMMMHMSVPPAPLSDHVPDVPEHIQRAVLRALAKNPEDRYESMAALAAALSDAALAHADDAREMLAVPARSSGTWPSSAPASASTPTLASVTKVNTPRGTFAVGEAANTNGAAKTADSEDGERDSIDFELPAESDDEVVPLLPEHIVTRRRARATDFQSGERTRVSGALLDPPPSAADEAASAAAAHTTQARARRPAWLAPSAATVLALVAASTWYLAASAHTSSAPQGTTSKTTTELSPALRAREPAGEPAKLPIIAPGTPATDTALPKATLGIAPSSTGAPSPSKTHASHHVLKLSSTGAGAAIQSLVKVAASPQPSAAEAPQPTSSEPSHPPEVTSAAPGYLSLDSEPWSNVSLGSQQLGSTPLLRVPLPPGKHVLTLSNPELGASTSYTVEISTGVTLSRLVAWHKP